MNNGNDLEGLVGELCYQVAYLMGRTQAYENYLGSLASVLVDRYPDLREEFQEKFNDVSDLHRAMIKEQVGSVTLNSYNETVKTLSDHFKLMKGGGFFADE